MVRTRSQLEHLSKDELIDELMSIEDMFSKLANLTTRFDDFSRRFEVLSSELAVSKNCNCLLSERIIQLEKNAVNNAQYHRRESIEVSPVPASIGDEELEDSICKDLLMSYNLLFNLGLNTCRETNIILLKFKTYLINSFQKKFIYHFVILAYLNLSSF